MSESYTVEAYNKDGQLMADWSELYSGVSFLSIKYSAARDGADALMMKRREIINGEVVEMEPHYYIALYNDIGDGPRFNYWLESDEDRFYEHLRVSEYLASKK